LLQNLGLPRYWREWENHQNCALTTDAMIAGLAHDKKGGVGYPRFVLPQSLGMVVWDQELDPDTLRSSIDVWLAH
jgi:3-dehydroquinate synthetase